MEQKPDTNIGLNEFYNQLSKFLFDHPTIKSRYNGESNSLISDLKGKNKGDTPKIANLFSSDSAGEIPIDKLLPRLKKEIKLSNYIVYKENE